MRAGSIAGEWELHDTCSADGQVDVLIRMEDDRLIALEHTSEGRNVWRREQPAITVRPHRWLASGATDVRLPERFPSPAWRWLGAMRTMSCSGVQGARR